MPTALGSKFFVNTENYLTRYGQNHRPIAEKLADGGFVVSWSEGNGFHFQRFDANGAKVGPDVLAGAGTDGSISVNDDGTILVTYNRGTEDVYAKIFSAQGLLIKDEFRVNSTTDFVQFHSNSTTLENGNFVIVWDDWSNNNYEVKLQIVSPTGQQIGGEKTVNKTVIDAQFVGDIAYTKDGGFVVAWATPINTGEAPRPYVAFQRFDAQGTFVGPEVKIDYDRGAKAIQPSVATLSDGNIVIAWVLSNGRVGDAAQSNLFFQVFDPSGAPVTARELVGPIDASNVGGAPDIASVGDGRFVLVWAGASSADLHYGIHGQVFDATGAEVTERFLIDDTGSGVNGSGSGINPNVEYLGEDRILVTWGASTDFYNDDYLGRLFTLGLSNEVTGTGAGETLAGGETVDAIHGAGGDDQLFGWGGDDSLSGDEGDDTIGGQAGNDTLFGGAGADTISGGAGNDLIVGGAGQDTLVGGDGADTYRFDTLDGTHDRVKGFVAGEDRIEIAVSAFVGLAGYGLGELDAAELAYGAKARTPGQHLLYNEAKGQLLYDADGVGGEAAVIIAAFTDKPSITAEDIILI